MTRNSAFVILGAVKPPRFPSLQINALDLVDGNGVIIHTEKYRYPRDIIISPRFAKDGIFTLTTIYGSLNTPVSGQFQVRYHLPEESLQLKTGSVFLGETFQSDGVFMVITYTKDTLDKYSAYVEYHKQHRKKRYGYL